MQHGIYILIVSVTKCQDVGERHNSASVPVQLSAGYLASRRACSLVRDETASGAVARFSSIMLLPVDIENPSAWHKVQHSEFRPSR